MMIASKPQANGMKMLNRVIFGVAGVAVVTLLGLAVANWKELRDHQVLLGHPGSIQMIIDIRRQLDRIETKLDNVTARKNE